MKAKKTAFWFMFSIFCLSLLLLIFAGWNIYSEKKLATNTLKEWESLLDEYSERNTDDIDLGNLVQMNPGEQEELEYTDEEHDAQTNKTGGIERSTFAKNVQQGALIGKITIPRLKRELPIIHGTGTKELAKGVGHYIGSALPGEEDNSVLSGHRQTVFRHLGSVQLGDKIMIETLQGQFTYEVTKQFIVDQHDRGVIVPHDEAILTLVTCYPFNFVGPAPERYILQAKLIDRNEL